MNNKQQPMVASLALARDTERDVNTRVQEQLAILKEIESRITSRNIELDRIKEMEVLTDKLVVDRNLLLRFLNSLGSSTNFYP